MQSEHDRFRFWPLLPLVVLMAVTIPLGVIALDSPTAWANPPLGAVLAGPFVPAGAPCATGNGRGMAFDGTNLYYTIVGDSTIYKTDTTGACLGAIPVPVGDPRVSAGGPLAWDGTHLWTVDYSDALTLYRVDPVTGATAASCSIPGVNPGHPALAGLDFPDGLHWTGITGSELVLSGEVSFFEGRPTAVAFMSPACVIASFFTSPPPLDGQWSGVAFDGSMLWHVNHLAESIEQTDLAGALTGVAFPSAGLELEDLEYDPVTFAPLCAVWANEATFGANRITAFEVPCGPPVCFGAVATIIGTEGNDILLGTPGDDVIVGLGGNDLIKGFGGDDKICGNDGDDIIEGGFGDDMIDGGAGNDLIKGQFGNDMLFGGDGDDIIEGGPGDDFLDGGLGTNLLKGQQGTDTCVNGPVILTCNP